MAASIYATPPPDLSSEDTALSDVSTSSLNRNSSNRRRVSNTAATTTGSAATRRKSKDSMQIDDVQNRNDDHQQQQLHHHREEEEEASAANMRSSTNADAAAASAVADVDATTQSATAAIAAVAAAANAAMQLQLLEAISDAAKKRRKQNNPLRLGALNLAGGEEGDDVGTESGNDEEEEEGRRSAGGATTIDYENNLSKMFPKSMDQLKETFEMLQQQQQLQQQHHHLQNEQLDNISTAADGSKEPPRATAAASDAPATLNFGPNTEQFSQLYPGAGMENPYHTYCKECGENFESEFKLSLHMLAEHPGYEAAQQRPSSQPLGKEPFSVMDLVQVKVERPDYETSNQSPPSVGQDQQQPPPSSLLNGKEPLWQHVGPSSSAPAGLGFPHFSPEAAAAAALSASGYLPLLGGMTPGIVDSLTRPPLRIFNPEAYCDLCNKEFCNKYFLKTHKANKHGIYDPSAAESTSSSNSLGPMFQLQLQQQQQQHQQQLLDGQAAADQQQKRQQQQQQASQPQLSAELSPPPPTIFCEICSKRFTNVFAMRRHRAKAHEQRSSPIEQQQQVSKSEVAPAAPKSESLKTEPTTATKGFQLPEGFREDFSLEQEEVAFTPQPRKLSLQSQQQAREANFSHEQLRRLGVVNTDAFCELCCKEYCNKYFLRTHKWKRHGIFVPAEDADTQKLPAAAWPYMQPMAAAPVNLVMSSESAAAAAAQRLLGAAKRGSTDAEPRTKRIKQEATEEDGESPAATQEAPVEKSVQAMSASPEPLHDASMTNALNLSTGSPEAAMGLQNLQKLQSMIQQLNDLKGKRGCGCQVCGKEMENQYLLHAHMIAEHSAPHLQQLMQQQQQQTLKLSPATSSPATTATNAAADLHCVQCDRDFAAAQEFKQHIAEAHLLAGSPIREGFVTPERPINAQAGTAPRPPYTMTPTSSYCEICNKELCNKYFMKTHMQRMHGIEIENGAQIGGVVCNICNKELCSKYFLRVHKHNTHGIVEEGAPLPQPRQNGLNYEQQQQQQQQQQPQQQAQLMDAEVVRGMDVSPFASSEAGKMDASEACQLCSRRFRHPKWLRAHLLSDHGAAGAEKLRDWELQRGALSQPTSPTLKIPNGAAAGPMTANPTVNLAQALQTLNSQHLLGSMPKAAYHGMFGAVADPALQQARFKEYQCSMCPFSTPYLAFLFIHERSHSIINTQSAASSPPPATRHAEEAAPTPPPRSAAPTDSNTAKLSPASPRTLEATDLSKHRSAAQLTPLSPTEKEEAFSESRAAHSVATSPIMSPSSSSRESLVKHLAQNSGRAACYAWPLQQQQLASGKDEGAPEMQAFTLEEQLESGENRFVPAIIYLPVKQRVSEPLTVAFKLTPV